MLNQAFSRRLRTPNRQKLIFFFPIIWEKRGYHEPGSGLIIPQTLFSRYSLETYTKMISRKNAQKCNKNGVIKIFGKNFSKKIWPKIFQHFFQHFFEKFFFSKISFRTNFKCILVHFCCSSRWYRSRGRSVKNAFGVWWARTRARDTPFFLR